MIPFYSLVPVFGISISEQPKIYFNHRNTLISLLSNTLNEKRDKVLPFYIQHGLPILRILTDRGSEYCGKVEHHDYQLSLAINDIDHTKTKARSPQINGICERFNKTVLQEFYQVAFHKKIFGNLAELQAD